jgi:hypothetical protein
MIADYVDYGKKTNPVSKYADARKTKPLSESESAS